MSIISAVKTYMLTYTGLKTGAPLWVDYMGPNPTGYQIVPTPGPRIVESYISGGSMREWSFAFQSSEYTADELQRMDTNAFFEALAAWFETQSDAGTLPNLGAGKIAEKIEATTWGFLFQEGESNTGIYQIMCKLTYLQDAP